MASNPPGDCCNRGFYHEGTPKGLLKELLGLETYVAANSTVSPSEKVIVILTDVFGHKLNNIQLIADDLACGTGFPVYVPDILFGDPIVSLDGSQDFDAWKAKHSAEKTKAIVDKYMQALQKEFNPKFVAVIGYCFGAKFAIQQSEATNGIADVCAVAHPSLVTMEEVAAIGKNKPLLLSCAETDPIFPAENRHATEAKLQEIGARYQLDLFGGVSHGFAARGDVSDPVVKYAKEKALRDQIHWIKHFAPK